MPVAESNISAEMGGPSPNAAKKPAENESVAAKTVAFSEIGESAAIKTVATAEIGEPASKMARLDHNPVVRVKSEIASETEEKK